MCSVLNAVWGLTWTSMADFFQSPEFLPQHVTAWHPWGPPPFTHAEAKDCDLVGEPAGSQAGERGRFAAVRRVSAAEEYGREDGR